MARRSKQVSPWHNCTRCGIKTHLSEMIRQRGVLVCTRQSCKDEKLIGQRESDLSKAITRVTSGSKELHVHPLVTNEIAQFDEDIIF